MVVLVSQIVLPRASFGATLQLEGVGEIGFVSTQEFEASESSQAASAPTATTVPPKRKVAAAETNKVKEAETTVKATEPTATKKEKSEATAETNTQPQTDSAASKKVEPEAKKREKICTQKYDAISKIFDENFSVELSKVQPFESSFKDPSGKNRDTTNTIKKIGSNTFLEIDFGWNISFDAPIRVCVDGETVTATLLMADESKLKNVAKYLTATSSLDNAKNVTLVVTKRKSGGLRFKGGSVDTTAAVR